MNKSWSDKNKKMQTLISKEATFGEGIKVLLELRAELFEQITSIVKTFPPEAFYQLPFGDGEGNHHTTLAWSLWHTFRIEDIVAHSLILKDEQILFTDCWLEKTKAKIITTGNELTAEEMIDFSKQLDIKATYDYCQAVMNSTNELLKNVKYIIKETPVIIECGSCGYEGEFEVDESDPFSPIVICPKCDGIKINVKSGRECSVKNIQIEQREE